VKQKFWIILFVTLFLFNGGKKKILNQKIFRILTAVWILIILQFIIYGGGFTPAMLYKPVWIFYTPFLVFTLMGIKYFKYLFNVIYFIAIYTSIIYLLQTFYPPFNDWLLEVFEVVFPYSWADWPRTILIYSAPREAGYLFMRNSGIYHEPGAYSIYLMYAILINTYFTKRAFHPKNIFLSIVLLSTFSTTGYIMLLFFYSYAVLTLNINLVLKPIFITFMTITVIDVYQNTEFLKEKVEAHYSTQLKSVEQDKLNQRGRFYAFGMSVKSFISNPITGRGIISALEYDVGKRGSFGYGFAGLFAMYGIFFSLFYMWFFYKGFLVMSWFNTLPKYYALAAFITINMGLLTQVFFLHTPFIYFYLIGLFYSTDSSVSKLQYLTLETKASQVINIKTFRY
jgi:hypothetical protein